MSNLEEDKNTSNLSSFTRENVEALGNRIRKTDSDEEYKLDLFCYVNCNDTDTPFLKGCRGLVFNEDKLVMKTFPYEEECPESNAVEVRNKLSNFNDFTFYESYEGALVRMFYFRDKWFVCTHRKLSAFKSKWASRTSFGEYFVDSLRSLLNDSGNDTKTEKQTDAKSDEKTENESVEDVLNRFQARLDTAKQYMFLVLNSAENRIVCDAPPSPTLFHVGTFQDGVLDLEDDVGVRKPRKLQFENVDELLSWVNNADHRKLQGVICFGKDGSQFKVFNQDYYDLFRARGNEPSIKFRYLQVRMNKKESRMLKYLYPNHHKVFENYENIIYDIANTIYNSYVKRYIRKTYVTLPPEEYMVMKDCHSWHLEDKVQNKISLEKVITTLNNQPATNLNKMIRRFHLENLRKQQQQASKTYMDGDRNHSPLLLSQKNKAKVTTLEI